MEYGELFNVTIDSIESKQWNPYLGISINNKYFTLENISSFASWGTENCREGFALLVVDILQRINNEVFDKSTVEKSVSKAFKQSDVILDACRKAVMNLSAKKRDKIVILEWPDIMDTAYCQNTRLLFDSFKNNEEFRSYILSSVANNLGRIVCRLNQEQLVTLCKYLLYELSEFLCGFVHHGIHYNLCIYPGSILSLTKNLLQQQFFQEIYSQLAKHGPMAHAEMYAHKPNENI